MKICGDLSTIFKVRLANDFVKNWTSMLKSYLAFSCKVNCNELKYRKLYSLNQVNRCWLIFYV